MLRCLILLASAAAIAGCATGSVSEYPSPNGSFVKTVKCSQDKGVCFTMAAKSCPSGGTYSVLASDSHAGGFGDDAIPGAVTWYSMTYACGASYGPLPTFPYVGAAPSAPSIYVPPARETLRTNCTTLGNTTNCTTR